MTSKMATARAISIEGIREECEIMLVVMAPQSIVSPLGSARKKMLSSFLNL
jgi:hypothetical protein